MFTQKTEESIKKDLRTKRMGLTKRKEKETIQTRGKSLGDSEYDSLSPL